MIAKLADIASIQFGLHAQPLIQGNTAYLQARHFDEAGQPIQPIDSFVTIDEGDRKHLLRPGDVLLAGKGFRIFAYAYQLTAGPAIASTLFFVIRVKTNKVIADYLATYFNLPHMRTYLEQLAAGSSIPSIRKSELAECPVPLPSLAVQAQVVLLQQLHRQDVMLSEKIIDQKKTQFQAVVRELLTR